MAPPSVPSASHGLHLVRDVVRFGCFAQESEDARISDHLPVGQSDDGAFAEACSGVPGQIAGIGFAVGGRHIIGVGAFEDDGGVRLQALGGDFCPAQADLFLDGEGGGDGHRVGARAQDIDEDGAADAVVEGFAAQDLWAEAGEAAIKGDAVARFGGAFIIGADIDAQAVEGGPFSCRGRGGSVSRG